MKHIAKLVLVLFFVAIIIGTGIFYWRNLRGVGPAIKKPSQDISALLPSSGMKASRSENKTDLPLSLPDGFSISILAKDLPGVRVAVFDQAGDLWISQPSRGTVSHITISNGSAANTEVVFKNLKSPHGLAFDPSDSSILYIAEETKITKAKVNPKGTPEKIINLPNGEGHSAKTIAFGPDGKLYVSIGSTCNVCKEKDSRRATIFFMNKDGSDFKEFARGLRNTVFFTWNPDDGKMWGTDMGRDYLGDNLPPDEINIIESGKDYGWPSCYGNNIHDNEFDSRNAVSCSDKAGSQVDIQAHSAPLGIAFAPRKGWPSEYQGDLIVAYHGSWNRTVPTGYKVVRVKLDNQGKFEGIEDFITGWQKGDSVLGRPVDVKVDTNGNMYITDDKAGVIYRVEPINP